MNAIIVDDEPLARLGVRQLLEKHRDIRIVAECSNGYDAQEAIQKHHPDLVFLDIQMPEMDGFEVLKSLDPKQMPAIIFITAYDDYAIRAFEVNALDYLLKPADDRRFEETLERAKTAIRNKEAGKLYDQVRSLVGRLQRKGYLDRLAIKENGRVHFLRNEEIDWIEAQGNYVQVHAGKASHLLRETISNLEEQLDPALFIRIHRSTLINVDRIRELQSFFHGGYRVVLKDGTQLLLSRRFRDKLSERLGQRI